MHSPERTEEILALARKVGNARRAIKRHEREAGKAERELWKLLNAQTPGEEADIERVGQLIARHVREKKMMTRGMAHRTVATRDRHLSDAAISYAIAHGLVVEDTLERLLPPS